MVYNSLPPSKGGGFHVLVKGSICCSFVIAFVLITFSIGIISIRYPFNSELQVKILSSLLDRSDLASRKHTDAISVPSNTSSPSLSSSSSLEKQASTIVRRDATTDSRISSYGHIHVQNPKSNQEKCDLFRGHWVEDHSLQVLYRNDTCPILTATQDCQGNGRPDKGYEKWRWRPDGCELPRFDPRVFLQLMRGKTLAFVGDSVARNQMESLMCMLWQAEEPMNKGTRKMQRWYFRSYDATIIRIWSSWLVNTTNDPIEYAPADLTKVILDQPDPGFMEMLPRFNVLVISGGHWFAKRTAYVLGNQIVGGQLWSHADLPADKLDHAKAFAVAMNTALKSISSAEGYSGITVLRTFSPDHYEGGEWNTGGSCTGKVRPFNDDEIVANPHTDLMRDHQLNAFTSAAQNVTNGSVLRLLDVTPVFAYRGDGHPGPYRNRDPNKITTRLPNGHPPPQDCLHWCMPGPIDTWNELLLEILDQELLRTS